MKQSVYGTRIRDNLTKDSSPKIDSGTICRIISGKLSLTFGKLSLTLRKRGRFTKNVVTRPNTGKSTEFEKKMSLAQEIRLKYPDKSEVEKNV